MGRSTTIGRFARRFRNSLLLALGDMLVLAVSLLVGRLLLSALTGAPVSPRFTLLMLPVWCVAAAAVGLLPAWGLGAAEELRRLEILLLSLFSLGGLAVLFGGGVFNPSRLAYAASWLCAAVGMPLMRVTMKAVLRRAGAWGCPAVIYGDQRTIRVVADTLRRAPEIGYSPVGVFTSDAPAGALLEGLPVLGGPREITADAEVAFVPLAEAMLHPLTDSLDRKLSGYRRLILLPELDEDIFLWVHPRPMGGLMGMEVASNLLSAPARMVKRAMDVGLTLLAAPVWLSAVALLGMAIWLSDGGAPFYCRPRMGRRGRPFRPIKFRTMVPDAERRLERALAENPALRAEWEATRKLRDDPRITRAGRLLRRWSLDELPQLLNVLAGTMSLVGPRPLPDYHRADISPGTRRLREQVRPGITGLWQVSGRSESGTAGMEKWDAYYVRNWSVWLDLVILARTVRAVLSGRGAY